MNSLRSLPVAIAVITALLLPVHIGGSLDARWLGDDWDFLAISRDSGFTFPLENHHYSLLMSGLFRLAGAGLLSPVVWRVMVLVCHACSCCLLHLLCCRGLGMGRLQGLFAGALFALASGGFEALGWISASGWVFSGVLIIAGAYSGVMDRPGTLAVLQLGCWAVWDTAALLVPMALAAAFLHRGRERGLLRRYGPALAAWFIPLVLKFAAGYSPGYFRVPGPLRSLRLALGTPPAILLPGISLDFLRSPAGILTAAVLAGLLAAAFLRLRRVRVLLALFLLALAPPLVFGAFQSRYLYIPSAFLLAALCGLPWRVRGVGVLPVLLTALTALHFLWARQFSLAYRGAFRQSMEVRELIESIPGDGPLAITGLPALYGESSDLVRPYMWRGGYSAFSRPVRPFHLPGMYWADSDLPPPPELPPGFTGVTVVPGDGGYTVSVTQP